MANKAIKNKQDKDLFFKCITLGEPCVGKTCLVERISHGKFVAEPILTFNPSFVTRNILLSSGQMLTLALWDTAGQERFHSLTYSYFRGAKVVLIVYDSDTKLEIGDQLKEVSLHLCKDFEKGECPALVFLVASKCDQGKDFALSDEAIDQLSKRARVPIQGQFVLSSKTGENVEESVREMAKRLWEAAQDNLLQQSGSHDAIRLGESTLDLTKKAKKKGCCG